jgi:TRAP-type C4-dicarboxylate transport system substrate-binding protein
MRTAVTHAATAAMLVLLATTSAACAPGRDSGAADKAGGSRSPVVLRLANSNNVDQPDVASIEHFAAEVAKLSKGSVRIRITYLAAGQQTPDVEARTIRMVQRGQFDLGWVGARAWDGLGVTSLEALQAPFLVTSKRLLDRIVLSPMASEMLVGIESGGVVGLALVPDDLRHPIGITHPLASLGDYWNARVRIQPSRVTTALFRTLGAVPVEISNAQIGYALGGGRLDGEELSLRNMPGGAIATANVALFGKALTLFARRGLLERLRPSDRRAVLAAAADTVRFAISNNPTDADIVRHVCVDRRRVVLASASDRAALISAARPLYRRLNANAQTRRYIAAITRWKSTTPRDPSIVVPAACRSRVQASRTSGALRDPSLVDGTYRWVLTAKDAHAWDPAEPRPGETYPTIGMAVLHGGKWRFPPASKASDSDRGTYTIRGNRIRFVWPRVASVLNFTFTRDHDGTLHLKPILPMDFGDQFVWAYRPWRRVGPPSLGR